MPFIASAGELKTKPAQHSVKELQRMGIQPDILLCRCEHPIPESARQKLALFCNMQFERVIEARDVNNIYEVVLSYSKAGLDSEVLSHFGMESATKRDLSRWETIVDKVTHTKASTKIAVIGKYVGLKDAYKSLAEALTHGGIHYSAQVQVDWIDAQELEHEDQALDPTEIVKRLASYDGILIPGGHGERGSAGKMAAIQYARETNTPFLGICLGLQLAVIEFARHVLGVKDAVSSEFCSVGQPVVGLITQWEREGQIERRSYDSDLAGTMRLGAYECVLRAGSKAYEAYGAQHIWERHRHRYEVDMAWQSRFEEAGFLFSGLSPQGDLPEMIELQDHPWFVATQAHPEFKSRPFEAHPLFRAFIGATLEKKQHVQKRTAS